MWVSLGTVVSAIAAEVGLDPDRVAQDKTNIARWVNDTRDEIYSLPVRLSAAEYVGEFAGTANVTAGTFTSVQNQAEITGSGTAWTSNMAGRYFQQTTASTGQWQRISFVSDATHLTLESGNPGSGVTGSSYQIWQRYYFFPHKVDQILTIFDMSNNRFPIAYYDKSEFYLKYGFGDAFNPPLAYTQFSSSELGYSYINSKVFSSVTCTANSPIVDFPANSGLVTGVAPGDRLLISDGSTSSTAFACDRVYTDTKLALAEGEIAASLTTATVTAFSMNRVAAQFYPAINNTNIYYYEARKRAYDLLNNSDLLEEGWYPAVKKGAIAKGCGYIRDPRETQKLQEYQLELQKLIRVQYKAMNPSPRLKPHIPRRYGTGGFFGYFPSKYDIPY